MFLKGAVFIYTEEADKGIIAILSLFHGCINKRGGVGLRPTGPAFSLLEIYTLLLIWGEMIFIRRGKL